MQNRQNLLEKLLTVSQEFEADFVKIFFSNTKGYTVCEKVNSLCGDMGNGCLSGT